MTSAKKRLSNHANGLHFQASHHKKGLRKPSLNALKHGLSLPVDEIKFGKQISQICELIQDECESLAQAQEVAKLIIDFERNEAFLKDHNDAHLSAEIKAWYLSPYCAKLNHLLALHRDKKSVDLTFTTTNLRPKGKERSEEIKFIEDFLKIQETSFLSKLRRSKRIKEAAERYHKRALNQLVKAVNQISRGNQGVVNTPSYNTPSSIDA